MIHMPHLQCEQIKFRPNVKMKVSQSVVAVGIVAGVRGGAGRRGVGIHVVSHMTRISAISLFCLVLPFLIKPNILK